MTELTIRTAVTEDVPAIVRIAERGWEAVYRDFLSQETILSPDSQRAISERPVVRQK